MATLKHINSKNADYGAAEQYLLFEHDEFTMKPVLDETGRLIPREDYRLSTLNCDGEDFAVACMRANLRYQKNQRREDVKSHHYIISFDPRDGPDNGLTVDRAQASLMSLENRFTTIDPATGNNIFYGDNANPDLLMELNRNARIWSPIMGQTILTDWAVEDGSFLRFSNLTIGYTLPKIFTRKFGVQNLRVYATGNNLFCWTAYSGQDPEVSTSKSNLSPGIDNSAYPKARSYVFGLNVTF